MKGQKVVFSQSGKLIEASAVVHWRFAFFVVQFKQVLPTDWLSIIEAKSGLPFPFFVGQVVQWWFHHRRSAGLLRALAERLVTHGLKLSLHWNTGRRFNAFPMEPPQSIQVVSTIVLFILGLMLYKVWYLDQIFVLLCGALGFVGGSVYRRSYRWWFCGDHLCHARVKTSRCQFCGCEVSYKSS